MIPVVTPEEMAAVDAAAPEPVEILVRRAGGAVARAAVQALGGTYGRRVVVVAGKGNNGADGREAARRLRRAGARVTVLDAGGHHTEVPPCDLVIDAAYGTGFRGDWRPPHPRGAPVLAVDIPSGVDGRTGEASPEVLAAVRTVTFAALKPGLLLGRGPDLAGEVVVADIGLDVGRAAKARLVTDGDVGGWLPSRPRQTHKWKSAVWVVAGSPGMSGAATLAARGALRAGAGYVRLSTPGAPPGHVAPLEAVGWPLAAEGWADDVLADAGRFRAVVVGPGLGGGEEMAGEVRRLVRSCPVPVVVDGDGLAALDGAECAGLAPSTVLTPHDGEYRRLCGHPPAADRLGAARELATATGAVVLLKGSTTVVAGPEGPALLAAAGDARLATAGTGDVLSGVVGALLAAGLDPPVAAAAAAHVHGRAAALGWPWGLVAGDLPELLPAVLQQLGG
ncbi:MAG TPA: NAD(P)H-hydrate dehydratase [Acidimicrobiales bacterium]|nr:NAD(P)H-hydrate dehydratase [Acidimicrobiales bacterium]